MTEAPKFFVPEVADANKYEEVFEALAALHGFKPPPADRRIYSITFVHDGEVDYYSRRAYAWNRPAEQTIEK